MLELRQRFLVVAHQSVGLAPEGNSPGVVGLQFDGLVEVGQRLLVPLHPPVGLAPEGLGEVTETTTSRNRGHYILNATLFQLFQCPIRDSEPHSPAVKW